MTRDLGEVYGEQSRLIAEKIIGKADHSATLIETTNNRTSHIENRPISATDNSSQSQDVTRWKLTNRRVLNAVHEPFTSVNKHDLVIPFQKI